MERVALIDDFVDYCDKVLPLATQNHIARCFMQSFTILLKFDPNIVWMNDIRRTAAFADNES